MTSLTVLIKCSIVLCLKTQLVWSQAATATALLGHIEYLRDVAQTVLEDLEENSWSEFTIPRITQVISQTFYNVPVLLEVNYENGVVTSVGSADVVQHTVQQILLATTTEVRGEMRLNEVELAFDVHVVDLLNNNSTQFYTAVFPYTLASYQLSVTRTPATNVITAAVSTLSLLSNSVTIDLMPRNNITEVISRFFLASTPNDAMFGWAGSVIRPVLNNVVQNKIQFPQLCLNCRL